MAPIQTKPSGSTGIGGSFAFTSNVTAGSLLYIAIRFNDFVSTPTVSDSVNGPWVQIGTTMRSAVDAVRFYMKNAGAGATTVTVGGSGPSAYRAEMGEYGGMDTTAPLDKSAQATGSSTAPSSGATATRTQASEIIIAAVMTDGANTFTNGPSFTLRENNSDPTVQFEDQTVAATGTDAGVFVLGSSGGWMCSVDTFKAAGGGGGSPITATIIASSTVAYGIKARRATSVAISGQSTAVPTLKARRAVILSAAAASVLSETLAARRNTILTAAAISTVTETLATRRAMSLTSVASSTLVVVPNVRRMTVASPAALSTMAWAQNARRDTKQTSPVVSTLTFSLGKQTAGKTIGCTITALSAMIALVQSRRAMVMNATPTSAMTEAMAVRRTLLAIFTPHSAVSIALHGASVAASSATGKYGPEHSSASRDIAAAFGFSVEHASALRDIRDAGV